MAECVEWWGSLNRDGYGYFGKRQRAHRAIFEECFGPIPEGFVIHHDCGNRSCVNPEHLTCLSPSEHATLHDSPGKWARTVKPTRTHCKHGHEFTEANIYLQKNPTGLARRCRTCNCLRSRVSE